jgi:nicotinate-nucleotide adenylyltransferase
VKIGIFGGTFDPPHNGHLIAAQDACEALRLDRLLFIPAGKPSHKRDQAISPAAVRLEMLQAAVAGDDRFEVSDLELRRDGLSYTADTLRQLRDIYSEAEFYLLLGADQVRDLPTWYQPAEVARLARIVLISRAGVDAVPQVEPLIFTTVRITRIDVSASDIRRRVADGRPIRYLVPAAVETIIRNRGLYAGRANPSNSLPALPNGDAEAGVAS